MKKNWPVDFLVVVLSCLLLGVVVDFAFNGIVIGYFSQSVFTEKLAYIYCTLYLAVAYGLSNYIPETKFHNFSYHGVAAFIVGALLGHLSFVGAHSVRVYMMEPDAQYKSENNEILFRSPTWQQVLFVTSDKVQQAMNEKFGGQHVPVLLEVVSDYGCDRESVISTVAGVDVKKDRVANWVWQVDRKMTNIEAGPNTEDHRFFWCKRKAKIKEFETMPGSRPWEEHPATPPEDLKKQ